MLGAWSLNLEAKSVWLYGVLYGPESDQKASACVRVLYEKSID